MFTLGERDHEASGSGRRAQVRDDTDEDAIGGGQAQGLRPQAPEFERHELLTAVRGQTTAEGARDVLRLSVDGHRCDDHADRDVKYRHSILSIYTLTPWRRQ